MIIPDCVKIPVMDSLAASESCNKYFNPGFPVFTAGFEYVGRSFLYAHNGYILMENASVDDPIFALATPAGESAIAVIRVSGKESLLLLSALVRCRIDLPQAKGHTIHHGIFINPQNGETVDEIMVAVYKAPYSYTGEDSAEIFTHGGPAIVTAVIDLLLRAGLRQAGPGEFTLRAFLNGKIDLTRAEAVNELIRARSDRARSLAISRLSGAIEKRIDDIKEKIADLLAAMEIMIDYPDEDLTAERDSWQEHIRCIEGHIERLLSTYRTGKVIQDGIRAVIAGRTNAGKSTLFNLLLREDRAIVSEIHGTTRDYLEGGIIVMGIPIRLFDTAGLRNTDNPLEIEGIKRTDQLLAGADLILYIVDGAAGITQEDRDFLQKYGETGRVLKIWNKTDLPGAQSPPDFIAISSLTGAGLETLHQKIGKMIIDEKTIESGEPVIDSIRQKKLLEECARSLAEFEKGIAENHSLDLLAADLKAAMECLGEITGSITTEEMLQRMFSRFCVGK